jgi:dTDP-4-dehydrorhamnose 3,5-epimerase
MKFTPTPLKGAFLIDLDKIGDERGFFARFFCENEFKIHGLDPKVAQANFSLSKDKGTLRGLHYQLPPYEETKLVRCLSGSLYDVILDIRRDSPTFGRFFGAVLTPENRTMMYVPRGFAHGFITLEPDTEILYLVSAPYSKEHERGIRFDDPAFNIEWPAAPAVISERDRSHRFFNINPVGAS